MSQGAKDITILFTLYKIIIGSHSIFGVFPNIFNEFIGEIYKIVFVYQLYRVLHKFYPSFLCEEIGVQCSIILLHENYTVNHILGHFSEVILNMRNIGQFNVVRTPSQSHLSIICRFRSDGKVSSKSSCVESKCHSHMLSIIQYFGSGEHTLCPHFLSTSLKIS